MEVLYYCEKCGKPVYKKFGSGRFCSRFCANSRIQTDEVNDKRSKTFKARYYQNSKSKVFNTCIVCGKEFELQRNSKNRLLKRKTCSNECYNYLNKTYMASLGGKMSAYVQSNKRRSKNEIYFYELCKNYFNVVKCNEPIFNGWDADIIIDDIKYAILWNGAWHYKKITNKHSVKQVQNRDKIKIKEITNCGYTPYVIKDMGKYNKSFVENEFNKFISLL